MHKIEEWHDHQANHKEYGSCGPQQAWVRHPELIAQQPGAYQGAQDQPHLQYQHYQRPATQKHGRVLLDFSHSTSMSPFQFGQLSDIWLIGRMGQSLEGATRLVWRVANV